MDRKRIVFAVGGTGGHLFPAQALAEELLERAPDLDILFAGASLNANRFLDKTRFRFKEVVSATPFRKNPIRALQLLLKGIKESLALFQLEKPDLVIGFGSYHSFPLLFAAKWKKIPFVLFEADIHPGKVNRLFSRYALFTAVHFSQAAAHLKGKTVPVYMPSKHRRVQETLTPETARASLGLAPDCFTLLVFGGSQGAKGINQQILGLLPLLKSPFQLIHITGNEETSALITESCARLKIRCYVKEFETQMGLVWKAASLFIGRSGASTLAEMMHFGVPGILIPYPHASSGHQRTNAQFIEREVQGGVCLPEEQASAEALCDLICNATEKIEQYKQAMRQYRQKENKETLGKRIYDSL